MNIIIETFSNNLIEEEKLEALLLERLQSDSELEFDIEDVRVELAKRLAKKDKL